MPALLATGNMNFALRRRSGCYYVDKTMYLRELIEPVQDPLLITRPRRFGKTLTQYTLKSFLELNYEHPGEPSADAELFTDLAVSKDTELCERYQSQFPVIFLTLKDVQQQTFADAYYELCGKVEELYDTFRFLGDDPRLSSRQREDFTALQRLSIIDDSSGRRRLLLRSSLLLLARCLHAVYSRPAYILIDEYDLPLLKAAMHSAGEERSYYPRMLDIIATMLGEVIKTGDPAVQRCILTGCLRITPEGRMSGNNNIRELGMRDRRCAALMGFTDPEVDELFAACGLEACREEAKAWYNGYCFGSTRIYNPWSIMNYCDYALDNPGARPQNYWIKTSSNDFRGYFIGELSDASLEIMQQLMDGEEAAIELREDFNYPDLDEASLDDQTFFTLLYHEGYITHAGPGAEGYRIPNAEVRECFAKKIRAYYASGAPELRHEHQTLVRALLEGDADQATDSLRYLLRRYISVRAQTASGGGRKPSELAYHAFLVGVLTPLDGRLIRDLHMDAEQGEGYADVSLLSADRTTGCIIELKAAAAADPLSLRRSAEQGLEQIRRRDYAQGLSTGHQRLRQVHCYGIGCFKKRCTVLMESLECRTGGESLLF